MKNISIQRKAIFSSLLLLLFFGCTKLLFENPIPSSGEIIQVLPDFFNGKFLEKGQQRYYDIERINDNHCIVYGSDWIHKDSINALVARMKNDSTYVEWHNNTLTITEQDTTQKIKLRLDEDLYYTEKQPVYELNLELGYFIDDFDTKNKKRAILKSFKQKYFLNIIDDEEKWFAAWIEITNDSLVIKHSQIVDTLFNDKLNEYNKLTHIKKLKDKTYIANPSDDELFRLIENPSLFSEEIWIRVDDSRQWSLLWIIVGLTFMLLFIIYLVIRKPNKNRRLN